jgi:hypothetical protein
VALGQVSKCPWVAQPETGLESYLTSLERPENSCPAMLPIQPDRACEDLQRWMGRNVIPNNTQGCNCCQRCF